MATSCNGCKWWSEFIASATGCGRVNALCLNEGGPEYNQMVHVGCTLYHQGRSVDLPDPKPTEDES